MADGGKAIRCAYNKLGVEVEKPIFPKREGYMRPYDQEKNNIKHVRVLWDGNHKWRLINAMYIRKA